MKNGPGPLHIISSGMPVASLAALPKRLTLKDGNTWTQSAVLPITLWTMTSKGDSVPLRLIRDHVRIFFCAPVCRHAMPSNLSVCSCYTPYTCHIHECLFIVCLSRISRCGACMILLILLYLDLMKSAVARASAPPSKCSCLRDISNFPLSISAIAAFVAAGNLSLKLVINIGSMMYCSGYHVFCETSNPVHFT